MTATVSNQVNPSSLAPATDPFPFWEFVVGFCRLRFNKRLLASPSSPLENYLGFSALFLCAAYELSEELSLCNVWSCESILQETMAADAGSYSKMDRLCKSSLSHSCLGNPYLVGRHFSCRGIALPVLQHRPKGKNPKTSHLTDCECLRLVLDKMLVYLA